MTAVIQHSLADRKLLPREHLLDSGYVTAEHLATSQTEHQVDLIGPAPLDTSWQARQIDGLDVTCFRIDWDAGQAVCPTGTTSVHHHRERVRPGSAQQVEVFTFDATACAACPIRARCTQSPSAARNLKVRPQVQFAVLQAARERQPTAVFKAQYAARAGIEGTISQGVRAFGLRASRYTSQAKTHLQHLLSAVAINLVRLAAWWRGEPRRTTRQSEFARFVAAMS